MHSDSVFQEVSTSLSRRTFVRGLAASGILAGLGAGARLSASSEGWRQPAVGDSLSGRDFDLTIGETPVNLTGRPGVAMTVNGTLPAPTLRWREGDIVTLRVTNRLRETSSIHWHGIVLPANMDGVPGLSFNGIGPGETYVYRFAVRQSGTYWYHSHSGFQEQKGLYGALVIDPREPDAGSHDREHVVLLSDWTDEDPARIFSKLKKRSDYYNYRQRTIGDFVRDARANGLGRTLAERGAWGGMRMNPTDLADVTGAHLHLPDERHAAGRQLDRPLPAGRARAPALHQRLGDDLLRRAHSRPEDDGRRRRRPAGAPGHRRRVPHRRRRNLRRHRRRRAARTRSRSSPRPWTAPAMRRGTLAVREGLQAPVPALDPRPIADHGRHGPWRRSRRAHGPGRNDPHAGHATPKPDDRARGHAMAKPADPPCRTRRGHGAGRGRRRIRQANEAIRSSTCRRRAPTSRLDDPGIGLRDNGRRVLTYADLTSTFADPDGRDPGRTIELHLTGHMAAFAWSFDGIKFSDAAAAPARSTASACASCSSTTR